jgi:hypothetical protein
LIGEIRVAPLSPLGHYPFPRESLPKGKHSKFVRLVGIEKLALLYPQP